MVYGPAWAFKAPQPPRPEHGLFSVAPPVSASGRIAFGVEIENDGCGGGAHVWRSTCPPGAAPPPKTKFEWNDVTSSEAFEVYAMPDCLVGGVGRDGLMRRAEIALDRSAEFLAEQELQGLFVDTVDAETTLTSSAQSVAKAVSLLECWLATNYLGGVGVIHAPRDVAPFAGRDTQAVNVGGKLVTTLGTRWSFAAGMCSSIGPDGSAAPANTAWLYASGQVFVWRHEVRTYEAKGALNPITNGAALMAEASYAVGFECGVAAAQVSLA